MEYQATQCTEIAFVFLCNTSLHLHHDVQTLARAFHHVPDYTNLNLSS